MKFHRENTIGNKLMSCENCNKYTDHEQNCFGWSCVKCESTKQEPDYYKLKEKEK